MKGLLYGIGRFLQFAGLILLPIAIAGNVANKSSVGDMLALSTAGITCFLIGWALQQFGDPK